MYNSEQVLCVTVEIEVKNNHLFFELIKPFKIGNFNCYLQLRYTYVRAPPKGETLFHRALLVIKDA